MNSRSTPKEINLISLAQAYDNIDKNVYNKFLNYLGITPKNHEVDDLKILVEQLLFIEQDTNFYSKFFFGFEISQIGKEFDLLRFGNNKIINIELKRTSNHEKIHKQLSRNFYYLSFLGKEILNYTFVSSTLELYTLDSRGQLALVNMIDLFENLLDQELMEVKDINILFDPTNYLVSPFNSTERFVNGEYFLTQRQETIKNQIFSNISKKTNKFMTLSGKAGTGKSILTYDIAKYYLKKDQQVLIIHCGKLNHGHEILNNNYGWKCISIKTINKETFEKYHLVIVDETQRIYPNQLNDIIKTVRKNNQSCLFSYDKQQCLRTWEISNDIEKLIFDSCNPLKFELIDKIRTNKEIAGFIKCLFNKHEAIHEYEKKNVELNYFSNYLDATEYLENLNKGDWKIINYTPSSKHTHPYEKFKVLYEENAHEVIGQEFDNVVAVIDSHFYYKGVNLSTRNFKYQPYYHPTKMLFQIMTRTRKKLNLIIINNDEIMERCLDILK